MTQTQLPRRPFIEQAPPPDGLPMVRREAARRRRRTAVGVVSAGVTVGLVTMLALLAGGAGDGDAVLRPAPAAPAPGLPTPGGVTVPAGKAAPRSHVPVSRPRPGGAVVVVPVTGTSIPASHDSPAAASDNVTLTRTRSSYPGAPRVCRTGDSSDGNGVHPGANWCLAAAAVTVDGGVRLSLQACRDSTSGGSLTFAGSREVDLVVKRDGKTVWSWSHDHPGSPSHHAISAPADGCWNWTLVWPGVDRAGAGVAHGDYVLSATSTADELYGAAEETAAFRY